MAIALLPITLTSAGVAALINFWLAFRCGRLRAASGGGLGTDGNALLLARSRSHANFAEYAPFILILIAVIELAEGSSLWLAVASALFFVGRIAHPLGMEDRLPQGRFIGTILALLALLVLGIYAISLPLRAPAPPAAVTAPPQQG